MSRRRRLLIFGAGALATGVLLAVQDYLIVHAFTRGGPAGIDESRVDPWPVVLGAFAMVLPVATGLGAGLCGERPGFIPASAGVAIAFILRRLIQSDSSDLQGPLFVAAVVASTQASVFLSPRRVVVLALGLVFAFLVDLAGQVLLLHLGLIAQPLWKSLTSTAAFFGYWIPLFGAWLAVVPLRRPPDAPR